ncbi:hypothetical protein IAQ61_003241 [Plenodomus lingam]|nr:hypothetical protein IAQ61_003241 [Plenodomus lingam]
MRIPAGQSWASKHFVGKIWKRSSRYDLIKFSKQPKKRMEDLVKKLESCVTKPECTAQEFWELAKLQDAATQKKHGACWAMQATIHREKMAGMTEKKERAGEAAAALADGGLTMGFGGLGFGDEVPNFLCEESFEQPLVKALLTPVPENIKVLRPEDPMKEMWWMSQEDAERFLTAVVEVVEGRQQVDELAEALGGMSFLGV